MTMTWRELIEKIPDEQLDYEVVAFDDIEQEYHLILGWDLRPDGESDEGDFYIYF